MHRKRLSSLALVCMAFLQFNCGGCDSSGDDNIVFIPDDDVKTTDVNYDVEAMNQIIASFSSPVEMAALLKASNVPFSTKYLVDPDMVRNYTSSFKKALGLGILSADLGYLNVYSKTSQILDYLVSIRQLTDDLKLGQFFEFATLKRLATSDDNIDSLLIMSVKSYQDMDAHLRNNQRSNLSALMVTGVWLESMYLVTQVAKEQPSEDFKNTIGSQKQVLKDLLPLLKLFAKESDKNFTELVRNLEELKDVLDVVKIDTRKKENVRPHEDGVFEQDYEDIVIVSDEELVEIITTTEKIHNKIIN
ncbi:MAG: hypothetical protein IIU11_01935 [Bacteroidales bacterium]|nr:hypothetical protein [Bacteroidales bacterium]MBR6277858.1 hypothetical protein [Bacteroidales bacterium]